ncbi:MAG: DUF1932 domain-containing protein [Geminicoccaceae bacterium]
MNEALPTVAVMSPGDMGHHVGALLKRHSLRVITSLEGRSSRTAALAAKAGIEVLADDRLVIREADMILAILVPAQALALAERLAPMIEEADDDLLYVDCNAIAPSTAERIATVIEGIGSGFVDAGIIGPPPRQDSGATRFYASGRLADRFACLNDHGLDVRVIGQRPGEASAVKMCYAALTKGTTALMTGLSIAAERHGVSDALRAEFALSQAAMFERMQRQVPAMVPKAHRWVGEMEEIAKTFNTAGISPKIFEGIADVYQDVSRNMIAKVTQEAWSDQDKAYEDVVEDLSKEP